MVKNILIALSILCLTLVGIVLFFRSYPERVATQNTVYAAGYSEEQFQHLAVGMTEEQVITLLGKPIDVFTNEETNDTTLHFSTQKKDTHYFIRSVRIENGKVSTITSELFID